MVAGGTPISRSRVIPPARPTTTASTTTPKRSSRSRTPAMPPLSPNANVPARLRTSSSMGLKPGTMAGRGLRGEPGGHGRDKGFDAGFERGMDHGGEARVVVGRQLREPARHLRLPVGVGVGAADRPEHRRRLPLAAE